MFLAGTGDYSSTWRTDYRRFHRGRRQQGEENKEPG